MQQGIVKVVDAFPRWATQRGQYAVVCQHCCPWVGGAENTLENFDALGVYLLLDKAQEAAEGHWLTHHFVKTLDWPNIVSEVHSRQRNVEDLLHGPIE